MERNTVLIVALVVIVVIALAVALLGGGSIFPQQGTHMVSAESEQQIMDYLLQTGDRIGMAFPDVTQWQKGESGSFIIAIRNRHSYAATFYVNAYLEGVGSTLLYENVADAANTWLGLTQSVTIQAGEIGTVTVTVSPSYSSPAGIYMFRAAVCESSADTNCHSTCPNASYSNPSPSIYGSAQFSFEILD